MSKNSIQKLSPNTITETIMYLDSRITQADELESSVSYHEGVIYSGYDLGMKEREFRRFVKTTAGQIVWPSDVVCELKSELKDMNQELRPCSAIFLMTSLILLFAAYFLMTIPFLLEFVVVPLLCILYASYYYLRFVINDLHILDERWQHDVLESDSVQLEETMVEILHLLQTMFSYQLPLQFHLAREYPVLVYTGRTKTTRTLVRLKEAVLYPHDIILKEETTGA